jgi:uncharacterized protein
MAGSAWVVGVLLNVVMHTAATPGPNPAATKLVNAAQAQIGVTVRYDPQYQKLAYPGGDVPQAVGVCTDVVIRAYRKLGLDLQVLVHEDMKVALSAYPKRWDNIRPDSHIDHRRVPNLQVFFKRHNAQRTVTQRGEDYAAGDVVTWNLPGNHPHIGVVSSKRIQGRPLVIHNIGAGTQEEDVLFAYPLTGHYRYRVE